MAFFDVDVPTDFIRQLERLGDVDRYANEILDAAAPIMVQKYRAAVQSEAIKGYATGGAANSIKAKKAKKNQYGHYVAITAEGKNEKGVRYGEEIAYLNYGTSTQLPRPVMTKTKNASEAEVLAKMQEKFNEVVGA